MVTKKKREVISHDPFAELAVASEPGVHDSAAEQAVETEHSLESEKVANDVNALDGVEIDLGDSLTIQDVAEMMEKINTVFDSSSHLILKADDVGRVDGAGIQFLCALFKEASLKQVKITWVTRSEVVSNAAMQLGMGNLLMLKAAA